MKFLFPFHNIFSPCRLFSADCRLSVSGMALCLCLLMISTLCLIGGAGLTFSALNYAIVHNGQKKVQAFYAAEAGRQLAVAHLRQNPLWRGAGGSASGALSSGGAYTVTLSDTTDDGNGLYDSLLPAGYVSVDSIGEYMDATQKVACRMALRPGDMPAAFPKKAVLSSGSLFGALIARNNYGDEAPSLLRFGASLPEGNVSGLKAMAGDVLPHLDNGIFDAVLADMTSFWREGSADTFPNIVCIDGDLTLSGERTLRGIIYVGGSRVVLSGTVKVFGVIYAPKATHVAFENGRGSGEVVILGQVITGPGGVQISGDTVVVRLRNEYADAFNDVAGPTVRVSMVPGTWGWF